MLEFDPKIRINHPSIEINYDPKILDTRDIPRYVSIGDRGVRGDESIGDLVIVLFGSFYGYPVESGLKLLKSFDKNNAKEGNLHRLSIFRSYMDFHQKPFSYFSNITDKQGDSYHGSEKIYDMNGGHIVFLSRFVVTPVKIQLSHSK